MIFSKTSAAPTARLRRYNFRCPSARVSRYSTSTSRLRTWTNSHAEHSFSPFKGTKFCWPLRIELRYRRLVAPAFAKSERIGPIAGQTQRFPRAGNGRPCFSFYERPPSATSGSAWSTSSASEVDVVQRSKISLLQLRIAVCR